jgi:2-methylisocitrate lyase-like PEP mutase family enzyme
VHNHCGKVLKKKIAEKRALLVPGTPNALGARIIADLGFEALYLTGAGVTNMFLGVPDLGFIGLSELAQHASAIRDITELPMIVDGETGFGNALNTRHAVRVLERAGANAIQIEDQIMPKRCGHFSGKEIVPVAEMISKIKSAVDSRSDENFLVIARTDSLAVDGFEAAIERAAQFIDAGADMTFVEAPKSIDEVRRIPSALSVPQVINLVIGGATPIIGAEDLKAMGFGLVLYANVALQGAIVGMQTALRELKSHGRIDERSAAVASFGERQRLVQKSLYENLERKYAHA